MFDEVNDDGDIASIFEERDRERALHQVLGNIPEKRDIDALLEDGKLCEWCNDIIPIERQRIVLTLLKSCDYCVECQALMEKQDLLYWG